ncbi:MAG TPA: hypothetical protein VM677_28485 [Actinokineospora sp.]|jgi:hypothetical protein|nr:hypothetical protein [Actinokineospora sp.]
MASDHRTRAAELWFRQRGLPSITRRPLTRLAVRVVPALVFFGLFDLLSDPLAVMDGQSDEDFYQLMDNDLLFAAYYLLLVGVVVIPVVGAWLATLWLRGRVLADDGKITAGVAIAVFVGVIPVFNTVVYESDPAFDFGYQFGLLVISLALTACGAGSVFAWALRSSLDQVRSLGRVTTRALPLLLLFTVFGFLTNEIWQMSALLTTTGMWWTVGLFALVAALFLLSMVPGEISALVEKSTHIEVADHELRGTPFDGAAEAERVPLRRIERANLVLVLVFTHLLQAVFVSAVMYAFFIAFGSVAVKHELMKTWSGRDLTSGHILGVQVNVPGELLQVSLFIAAFSAVYFVASTATDTLYRGQFFDPLTRHMAISLAARDIYLADGSRPVTDRAMSTQRGSSPR